MRTARQQSRLPGEAVPSPSAGLTGQNPEQPGLQEAGLETSWGFNLNCPLILDLLSWLHILSKSVPLNEFLYYIYVLEIYFIVLLVSVLEIAYALSLLHWHYSCFINRYTSWHCMSVCQVFVMPLLDVNLKKHLKLHDRITKYPDKQTKTKTNNNNNIKPPKPPKKKKTNQTTPPPQKKKPTKPVQDPSFHKCLDKSD